MILNGFRYGIHLSTWSSQYLEENTSKSGSINLDDLENTARL